MEEIEAKICKTQLKLNKEIKHKSATPMKPISVKKAWLKNVYLKLPFGIK